VLQQPLVETGGVHRETIYSEDCMVDCRDHAVETGWWDCRLGIIGDKCMETAKTSGTMQSVEQLMYELRQ